jgi:hypothetical protein
MGALCAAEHDLLLGRFADLCNVFEITHAFVRSHQL